MSCPVSAYEVCFQQLTAPASADAKRSFSDRENTSSSGIRKPKTSETSQTDVYLKNELPEKAMSIIKNYQDQIKEKDQQLSELHNLLNQQQQLTLQSNQHIQQLQLELSKDNEDNSSQSETEHSSFTDNEVEAEQNKKRS